MPEKEIEWIEANTISAGGYTMIEYIDLTGTWCKQVWDDGYTEIFEIAK